jgi:hypothetical protein
LIGKLVQRYGSYLMPIRNKTPLTGVLFFYLIFIIFKNFKRTMLLGSGLSPFVGEEPRGEPLCIVPHCLQNWNQILKELKEFYKLFGRPKAPIARTFKIIIYIRAPYKRNPDIKP